MPAIKDGPGSTLFTPLRFEGNTTLRRVAGAGVSEEMAEVVGDAPSGECVGRGIPFVIEDVVVIKDEAVSVQFEPVLTQQLVFMHTSDQHVTDLEQFFSPMRGQGYERMRLVLTSAHRSLHNRMHQLGYYHDHTPVTDHPAHRE